MTDRLIRITTAVAVTTVAAVISDRRNQPVPPLARGAWVPGSLPPSAPTWHMASVTARSVPGPRWRLPVPSNSS